MDELGEAFSFTVLDGAIIASWDDGIFVWTVFLLIVGLAYVVQVVVLAFAACYWWSLLVLASSIAARMVETAGGIGAAG